MSEEQEKRVKYAKYNEYTKGTEYYLMNRRGVMSPIVFDISTNGQNFTFTPNETFGGKYDISKFTDNSLLKGISKIMAKFTKLSVDLSLRFQKTDPYDDKDKRFVMPINGKKDVVVYIDFTHNMVLQDNAEEYKDLATYIFPNHRSNPYSSSSRGGVYLPKKLIKITFNNGLYPSQEKEWENDIVDYFRKYLDVFGKDKKLQNELKCLKIRQQIDIPIKFVVYGACNKFGENFNQYGLVGILYVEHKIPLSDYVKFKDMCNEQLNEVLKPLNMTYKDIIDLTYENAVKKYDTFAKIDKLARACGRLKDPRGCKFEEGHHYDSYDYIYYIDNEYSDDFGLYRWEAIKKYYPELYKGLKIILDIYIKFKKPFEDEVHQEFNKRLNTLAGDYWNRTMSYTDDQLFNVDSVIKYVNDVVSNIQAVSVDDLEDLKDTLDVLNQNILDKISHVCQEYYRHIINDYNLQHPRAKKMEIDFRDIFTYQNKNKNALKYCPFSEYALPDEIKNILNNQHLESLKHSLYWYSIKFGVTPIFYSSGKKLEYREKIDGTQTYQINDIVDALKTFKFQYVNNFEENISKITPMHINPIYTIPQVDLTQEEINEVVNAFFSSPIKFKVQWFISDNYKNLGPELIEPANDTVPADRGFGINVSPWRIDSERTLDDVMADTKTDIDAVRQYMDIVIIFEYQKPELIVEKLKQTDCYKKAIGEKEWR